MNNESGEWGDTNSDMKTKQKLLVKLVELEDRKYELEQIISNKQSFAEGFNGDNSICEVVLEIDEKVALQEIIDEIKRKSQEIISLEYSEMGEMKHLQDISNELHVQGTTGEHNILVDQAVDKMFAGFDDPSQTSNIPVQQENMSFSDEIDNRFDAIFGNID